MLLPNIVVVAEFESSTPVGPVDESEWYKSRLRILWYQDRWALPIDYGVLEQIVSLDWEAVAVDEVMPY